jgi:hypothetical protein
MLAHGQVQVGGAAVDLQHLVGDPVEHVAVVGDQHQAAAIGGQPLLQELDGIEVEMVGGLVEDQRLVLPAQQAGQRHPLGLATGQFVGATVDQRSHTQPVEHRLALPAAAHRVAHAALGQHGLLCEKADARTAPPTHLAGFGVGFATQEAQQRALAAAVDADHTDAVTVAERERDVVEQRAVGARGLQAGGVDQDHGAASLPGSAPSALRAKSKIARPHGLAISVWAGQDSNLRRRNRLIYSQLPLATRAPTHRR